MVSLKQNRSFIAHCSFRAMIKSATTDSGKMCLRREYHNYRIDEIASSPYIRALYDTVDLSKSQDDPPCLVFEWMDHDLRAITAPEFRSNPKLPKAVSHGILSALNVLKTTDAVHTGCISYLYPSVVLMCLDISPNNIFISHINGSQPVAKLGDLGNSKCHSKSYKYI